MKWATLTREQRLEIIEPNWREGLSASEIAKLFDGCSRNAIIGYVHRAGLTRPQDVRHQRAKPVRQASRPAKPQGPRKPRKPRPNNFAAFNAQRRKDLIIVGGGAVMERNEAAPSTYRPKAIGPLPESNPKPWIERAFGECAYPVEGEGADTVSCCAPCGDHTYCKGHRRVMYVPAKEPVRSFVKGVAKWAA